RSAMTAASAPADRTKPLLLSVPFQSAAPAISRSSMSRPPNGALSLCVARSRVASVVDRVTDDWAGHAVSAPASAAELGAGDGDDLDARLSQKRVGVDVAVVGKNDARRGTDEIGAAVPLRALAHVVGAAGLDDAHLLETQGVANRFDQAAVLSQIERSGLRPGPVGEALDLVDYVRIDQNAAAIYEEDDRVDINCS